MGKTIRYQPPRGDDTPRPFMSRHKKQFTIPVIQPGESLPATRSARLLSGRVRKHFASRKRVDFDVDDLVTYTNTISLNSSTGSYDNHKFEDWDDVDVPIMKKLARRNTRLERAMRELGDNYLVGVDSGVSWDSDRQTTEENDVDSASTPSITDSSGASGTHTFVDFDEAMASSGFVSVYSDDNPLVSVRPAEAVAAIVYDSEVPQPVSDSDSDSDRVEYQSESEEVASSSAYETNSSRPETRDSVVVLTSSPRVNTTDYPESVASLDSLHEFICGHDQDSLPSYSAAIANGYMNDDDAETSPCPPVDSSSQELREEPPSANSDLDFPLGRFNLDEEVELNVENRTLSDFSSLDTSTSFSESSCSSSECYASDSDDSSDSDEDEGGSHSDATDDDGSDEAGRSESEASQGPRYNFDDSIDGDSTEEYETDDSASEANSDDKYRILLSTIANMEPEDLIPMCGESSYSSSESSSGDNSYDYHSGVPNGVPVVASRSPSSSYDYYDQMSYISSEDPRSLDTKMREELGITIGHIDVVDHSNSSEERLDSSLSQFNETGSRGSILGNLHLGRDLWSELSRSPPPPKSPPPFPMEALSPDIVQKKFKWDVPPAAPFPKPRLTFDETATQGQMNEEEVIKTPMPFDVQPPLPFPYAPALSIAFTEASEDRSFDYFPSTIVSCEDARLDETLTLGTHNPRSRVSRRVSFTHTRLRLDVWNSMADILCGHDLPGGGFQEQKDVEQMERQSMSAFLSDPMDSHHVGLSTSSAEVDERDLEASDLDEDLMVRLRRYSMVDTGISIQHVEEVIVSPHSQYAPASSSFFSSSDYNSSGLTPTPDTSPQDFLPTDDEVLKVPLMCETAAMSSEGSSDLPVSESVLGDSASYPDVSPKSLESSSVGVAKGVECSSSSMPDNPELSETAEPISSCTDRVELMEGSAQASTCYSSNFPTSADVSAPLSTSTRVNDSTDVSSSGYYTSSADVSSSQAPGSSMNLSPSKASSASIDSKPTCSPLMEYSPSPVCGITPAIPPRLRGISLYSPTMVSPESDGVEGSHELLDSYSDVASVITGAATVDVLSDVEDMDKMRPSAIPLVSPAPFPSHRVASPGVIALVPYQLPKVPFAPSTEGRKEIAAMASNLQSELSSYFDTPKQYKGKMVLNDTPAGVLGQPTSASTHITDENVMVVAGSGGVSIVDDSPTPGSGSASTRGSRKSKRLKCDGDSSPRLLISLKERVKRSFKSESKLRKNELEDLAAAAAGLTYKSPTWKSPSWKSPSFKSPSWKSPSHHSSSETMKRHTISKFFSRSRDATLRD
ncbi:hypothetical protein CJU90_1505 [Yarrowia sp. C11]|nr:hypothetical protein CKK34_0229 [Yarrowia sp. E02]KAG5371473.1 hypothetical protein CJU90_1505 [Yarrowia sp. C11]